MEGNTRARSQRSFIGIDTTKARRGSLEHMIKRHGLAWLPDFPPCSLHPPPDRLGRQAPPHAAKEVVEARIVRCFCLCSRRSTTLPGSSRRAPCLEASRGLPRSGGRTASCGPLWRRYMALPHSGKSTSSTRTCSPRCSLTRRFFSSAIMKLSPWSRRNLKFSTPEYQLSAVTMAGARPQPRTSLTISRNRSFLVLPCALSTTRKLTGTRIPPASP